MAKKKKKALDDIRLLVVFSDLHSGSVHALMPPEYALFEKGTLNQIVKANAEQLWLYDCWTRAWEKVIEYVGGDPWAWVFNGDAIEGKHHGLSGLVSNDITDHMMIFHMLNEPYAALAAKRFFVRGTETHTGWTTEMKIAEKLNCEKHPDTGQWASDRWMLNVNGFNVLFRHHMSTTSREYLRGSALTIEYGNEVVASRNRGQPTPDGCVFAHRHGYDWWNGCSTFAMVCGPWQQSTRFGHKNWSPMVPEPTITVLDWRNSPPGGMPQNMTFKFVPPPATVVKL